MISVIIYAPLIGFLINGLWSLFFHTSRDSKKTSSLIPGLIATAMIFCSFISGLAGFLALTDMPHYDRVIEWTAFKWIEVGELNIHFRFVLDSLSSLFVLVITGVGTLIHIYSIGYMSQDETAGRYFAYLNLFCFAMLILVLGSSLPVLFLGWEGVGLCSYLLIGYWYEDSEKASAGKKAFIVNRVGDFGVLLAMFLIFTTFGTLEFAGLREAVLAQSGLLPMGVITTICLLLFLGCTGKSAQIPLYVWLPDAMAGPTPVSALIHAATMVTSGIYLITRLNFLFILSPTALEVVAWTGAITALFAATMAFTQRDIKKVLAYSTISQLGYMFLACGVGAFSAGVFHVITHAFFKALMFLGAGSVIYGMHHEQDMMKMGGLAKKMPKTHLTFLAGWLAICGIPGFSGFFSKDEILWFSWGSEHGSRGLWFVGFITAAMTVTYMTRLMALTFWSEPRFDSKHPPQESPNVMVFPLIVLAVLSVIGGLIGFPHASWIHHWLENEVVTAAVVVPHSQEWLLMGTSSLMAIGLAYVFYKTFSDLELLERLKQKSGILYKLSFNKWYVDEIYELLFVRSIYRVSIGIWKYFDIAVIDRIVLGVGRVSSWSGQALRLTQTGTLQTYAMVLLTGVLFTLGWILYGAF